MGNVAGGKIRRPAVRVDHADIGGMRRLDLDMPRFGRDELQRHVVAFRAEFGRGSVDDLHRQFVDEAPFAPSARAGAVETGAARQDSRKARRKRRMGPSGKSLPALSRPRGQGKRRGVLRQALAHFSLKAGSRGAKALCRKQSTAARKGFSSHMTDISGLFLSPAVSGAVSVERAVAELRAGRPVVLSEGSARLLVFPAENLIPLPPPCWKTSGAGAPI